MSERYVAIIEVDAKILLKMLDFEGGIIHRVFQPDEVWKPGTISLVLEHPDLDKVEDGYTLRRKIPIYKATYGEGGSLLKVERIDPPKKSKKERKEL